MIRLYYHPSPNPKKIALFLEEAELSYEVVQVDTRNGDQHKDWFRKINPNGKTPAIDDTGTCIFDSNAILLHLAEKIGSYLGPTEKRGELLSWLMFVATGVGPYSGQAVHFRHFAPEGLDYAVKRYTCETARHYEVLDQHLEERTYLVDPAFTIADMALWGWAEAAHMPLGDDPFAAYPNVKRWYETVSARPAAQRARKVGENIAFKTNVDEEAKRYLFPQTHAGPAGE